MKKSKLFFFFISLLIFVPNAYALTDITSIPSGVGSTCNAFSCWPQYNSKVGKSMRGMRVSLMKTDGTQVGKTYNIIADDSHFSLLTDYGNYTVLGSNCNKVQYEKGLCSATVSTQKTWDDSPWTNGNLGVASAVASYFSHLNVPLQTYLSNWDIDSIWEWADTEKLPISDERNINLLSLLFSLSRDEILNMANDPDLLNDLWIVVEPFTMLRYNYKNYLGTSYELSKFNYTGMLQSNVTSVVGRMMPCAAMTTGEIATKYPKAPGISSGSYFDGSLVYVNPSTEIASSVGSSTISQICSSTKKFKNGYTNTNKGVGVGIIYFKDLFKNELSCEDVDSGMSDYNSFMNKIDNAYKNGGLDAIYALPEVIDGIKYIYEGETRVADKVWYINECTCYGLYDTYKQSTGVEIYSLPKGNIKTIFDQKLAFFNSYVDDIRKQVQNISASNPTSVGTVTTWDYKKYELLQCGFTSSSCEDVDFKNLTLYEPTSTWYCRNKCQENGIIAGFQIDKGCYNRCVYDVESNIENNNIVNQCYNLPLFPSENFTDSFVNSNGSLYNSCFAVYNKQFGTNWNLDRYQEAGCITGGLETKKIYDCTPRYNVGTCINQENVFYTDSSQELNGDDYWKYCVFSDEQASYDINPHKWSDKEQPLTYFDSNITSDYCEVYCIESMTGAFNSETIQVKAGQHFIWNDHSVSGSRTCKTKSIEWDKFTEDLKNKNNEIEKAFNTYLVARDQQASVEQYDITNGCSTCTKTCSSTDSEGKTHSWCCARRYWDKTCIKWDAASYGSGATLSSEPSGSACSCSGYPSADRFNRDTKYTTWNNMKDEAKYIYDQMKKCYNEDKGATWISTLSSAEGEGSSWDQWLYIVDPTAEVHYNYTVNGKPGLYSVNEEMDRVIEYTAKTNINDCQTVSGGIEVLTSCSNASSSCTRQMLGIKKCTKVEMKKGANVEFQIPDGIYEYVEKENNTSFSIFGTDSDKKQQLEALKNNNYNAGQSFNYIYLGYSNFPVEYKTPDGLYGKDYGNGELSITYSNLGYKLPDKSSAVDEILNAIDSNKYGDWQCQFEVVSELIPDYGDNDYTPESSKKGDINLVYRPIDLYDPFPDTDADGREVGSNWCASGERTDCSNTNRVVQDVILNNRGVVGHEVYSEDPMYTFILTPSIIKEIRNYNDNNNYANYYGTYNGEVFDFKCNTGTGQTCISDYLSYIIDITDAKNQPGTCVDDKYRTYNDPNNFDACRY